MELNIAGRSVHCHSSERPFDAARPAVVMIHGAGHDHSVWQYPARHLARHGFAVIAPDLPGHGRTQGPGMTCITALADWLVALMDALEIASAALLGHSMGSLVALQTAARHQERISSLTLIGSAVPMPVADILLQAASDNRTLAHSMINQWSYTPASQLGNGISPGMWLTGLNRRLMERQTERALADDLKACNSYLEGAEAAASVRCPVLLVNGARDQMTPSRASQPLFDMLARSAARVTKKTIPATGHAIMAEAPDKLNPLLRAFLSND